MKLTMQQLLIFTAFAVMGCVFATDARAWDYYDGCLECKETHGWLPSSWGQECAQVGDGEYGDGIECADRNEGLGWQCQMITPYPCYNVDVTSGGGSGGGGGFNNDPGSGGCARVGGACPAYCSSC